MRAICILIVLTGMYAAACQAEEPGRVAPEEFAILPWNQMPGDAEVLRGVHDCGFNLAGFVSPEHLDAVKAVGLKAIVHGINVRDQAAEMDEEAIRGDVRTVVSKAAGHPAVFGYYLLDEPSAKRFPLLARYSAALRELDPKARPYINLFPNYANETQLGTPTYEEHLERYITIVKPPFVSYDHYALFEDGTLRDGYFQNLEAARAAARKHKLPFWNIVLSNAHFNYAEPSDAGFRFQAFTTLAYGARGLSYFTYLTPPHCNYRLAPLDEFGAKTPTWAMLRRVNLQIHALAPVYVKLEHVNVFHHPEVPKGCRGLDSSQLVAEIRGPGSFLVGEFKDPQGRPFAMVVNKDLHRSTSYMIRFKQPGRIMQVHPASGQLVNWVTSWGAESDWLAPGQGMLLGVRGE